MSSHQGPQDLNPAPTGDESRYQDQPPGHPAQTATRPGQLPYSSDKIPGALTVSPSKKKRGPIAWVSLAVAGGILLIVASCAAALGHAVGSAGKAVTSGSPTPTSPSSSAASGGTLSLYQSCTNVTEAIEGTVDFGYDDSASSETAGSLATVLRQNVTAAPAPINDDIALLIKNLDQIQSGTTMKVADFTEPAARVLDACDVTYTSPNDPYAGSTDSSTDESSDDSSDEPTEAPVVSKKDKAFNALSDEQQEAVDEGRDYLDSSAFSKQGLIDQLDSDYGAQYKKKDAEKAVAFLDKYEVNWNKQAVRAAKEYRESSHFSTQGLIDQLDSDYGGQFTHSQAVYGAKHSR